MLPGNLLSPERLSLIDAINTSLAQNPDLVTLRTAEGVSGGALGVARTYPFNPYVQIQALPYRKFPDGAKGYQYDYILLMQTLQLGHQQRFRKECACSPAKRPMEHSPGRTIESGPNRAAVLHGPLPAKHSRSIAGQCLAE